METAKLTQYVAIGGIVTSVLGAVMAIRGLRTLHPEVDSLSDHVEKNVDFSDIENYGFEELYVATSATFWVSVVTVIAAWLHRKNNA